MKNKVYKRLQMVKQLLINVFAGKSLDSLLGKGANSVSTV
jgi:hypothetical protein